MRLVRALAAVLTSIRRRAGAWSRACWRPSAASRPHPRCRAGPPPISFADIVERVAPAVVNISTTKAIARGQMPDFPFPEPPPGSPFEDFFREFFDQDRPPEQMPRRQSSLGSGFVVDPGGLRRHQQSRDRRSRRDPGRVQRRDDLRRQAGRPRHQDRSGAAQDRGRPSACARSPSPTATPCGSATGSSPSAIRSGSAAP